MARPRSHACGRMIRRNCLAQDPLTLFPRRVIFDLPPCMLITQEQGGRGEHVCTCRASILMVCTLGSLNINTSHMISAFPPSSVLHHPRECAWMPE